MRKYDIHSYRLPAKGKRGFYRRCTNILQHGDMAAGGAGLFRRWLKQCRLEQLKRGQIPIVVPYTDAYRRSEPNPGWTSAGWGDAIIFAARDLYEGYGNINILEENYEAMENGWLM